MVSIAPQPPAAPFNPFQGGRAAEDNARGQALRSLGFTGGFNVGRSGFGGADFLKTLDAGGQSDFNRLFSQFTNEANQVDSSTGVVPIGVIEPLSQTTRQGITRISGGVDNSAIDQMQRELFARLSGGFDLAGQAAAPITDQEFNERFGRFSNKFQQDVIDRAISNVNRQESIKQSDLARSAQAGNAFGGSAQGVASGILGGESLRNIGDLTASLNAANFSQASQNAQSSLAADRARQFLGAQTIGSLAGQQTGIAQGLQGLRTSGLQNLIAQGQAEIGAGGVVQQQNQRMLDAIQQQRDLPNQLKDKQMQQLLAVIQAFTGGGSGTPGQAGGSTLSNIIGGGLIGSNFDFSNMFGGGGGSSSGGSPFATNVPFGF